MPGRAEPLMLRLAQPRAAARKPLTVGTDASASSEAVDWQAPGLGHATKNGAGQLDEQGLGSGIQPSEEALDRGTR